MYVCECVSVRERNLEVIWQFRAAGITRVHGDAHKAGWLERYRGALKYK